MIGFDGGKGEERNEFLFFFLFFLKALKGSKEKG